MGDGSDSEGRAQELFDEFVSASTCRATLRCFSQLCQHLLLDCGAAERPLYQPIKRRLNYWKANALWAKLDRRAAQPEYQRARVCRNLTVSAQCGSVEANNVLKLINELLTVNNRLKCRNMVIIINLFL